MKNIKFLMMMVLALGLTFTTPAKVQAEDTKIAYVDLSRLFDEYYKTKEQDKVLESQFKEFEAEHKTKAEEIQASKSKLSLLTDDKKADLEKEIQAKTIALQEYDRQKQTDLTKERNEKIREILLEIEKIVSTYAEAEGYSIILNDRVLIYGKPTFNITEQVLEKLNASKPSEE